MYWHLLQLVTITLYFQRRVSRRRQWIRVAIFPATKSFGHQPPAVCWHRLTSMYTASSLPSGWRSSSLSSAFNFSRESS